VRVPKRWRGERQLQRSASRFEISWRPVLAEEFVAQSLEMPGSLEERAHAREDRQGALVKMRGREATKAM
jgi:hypothetical protein